METIGPAVGLKGFSFHLKTRKECTPHSGPLRAQGAQILAALRSFFFFGGGGGGARESSRLDGMSSRSSSGLEPLADAVLSPRAARLLPRTQTYVWYTFRFRISRLSSFQA